MDSGSSNSRNEETQGRRETDSVQPLRGVVIEHERDQRTDRALKALNNKSENGNLLGLAYIAICRGGRHVINVSGMATDYPDMTNGLAFRMMHELLEQEKTK